MHVVSCSSPIKFPPFPKPYSPRTNVPKSARTTTPSKHSLLTLIFKSLDDFITNFLDDLPLRPSIDPTLVLSGNFKPVDELPPTPCHVVQGVLPTSLNGAYIRNGPNPRFTPGSPYHIFDGDGMLHAITVLNGNAILCSRYVRTHKLMMENEMGHPFFPSPFSSFNGFWASMARSTLAVARALSGYFHPQLTGFGTANTSLVAFGGGLFALYEMDLPYKVKVTPAGEIITVSRHDFRTENPPLTMTVHPKIDSETGEAFAYSCHIFPPFLTFFRIDSWGRKLRPDVPIFSITKQSFVHDFAVTKHFIVFPDIQVVMKPVEILRGRSPVVYNEEKVPRVGILPRQAEDDSELVWVEVPGFNMMHVINAWEEDSDGKIVIVAPNVLSVKHGLETIRLFDAVMEKVTIDVRTRKLVRRETLSGLNLEFGVINPAYAGKRNR